MSIWEWFNNKKTTIGAVLLLIAQALRILYPDATEEIKLLETVAQYCGASAVGVGLTHKIIKKEW